VVEADFFLELLVSLLAGQQALIVTTKVSRGV
jgi:hypothetical protein